MTLTGQVQGTNRKDLTTKATKAAATYYGTLCVLVELSDEETLTIPQPTFDNPHAEIITGYQATYTAKEDHSTTCTRHCPTCGKDML